MSLIDLSGDCLTQILEFLDPRSLLCAWLSCTGLRVTASVTVITKSHIAPRLHWPQRRSAADVSYAHTLATRRDSLVYTVGYSLPVAVARVYSVCNGISSLVYRYASPTGTIVSLAAHEDMFRPRETPRLAANAVVKGEVWWSFRALSQAVSVQAGAVNLLANCIYADMHSNTLSIRTEASLTFYDNALDCGSTLLDYAEQEAQCISLSADSIFHSLESYARLYRTAVYSTPSQVNKDTGECKFTTVAGQPAEISLQTSHGEICLPDTDCKYKLAKQTGVVIATQIDSLVLCINAIEHCNGKSTVAVLLSETNPNRYEMGITVVSERLEDTPDLFSESLLATATHIRFVFNGTPGFFEVGLSGRQATYIAYNSGCNSVILHARHVDYLHLPTCALVSRRTDQGLTRVSHADNPRKESIVGPMRRVLQSVAAAKTLHELYSLLY